MATENVIDLTAIRAKLRHGSKWDKDRCQHRHVTIDRDAGTVDCDDCGKPVSAFHLILSWLAYWHEIDAEMDRLKKRCAEMRNLLKGYKPRLRAIQALEKRWWRGNILPTCPHCSRGLIPEDFVDGGGGVGREYEMARRAKDPNRRWR